MIFCNQSAGPVVADQLLEETYRARGQGGEELALDIENSGIVMAPADPVEHLDIHSAGDAGGGCLRHPL